MKPFATLGSEIGKVRERVRRSAESLRSSRVAVDVKEQRDRLLAKLGEQTFRLVAERKLAVPKVLQDSVERLAALLGVQLPQPPVASEPEASAARGVEAATIEPTEEPRGGAMAPEPESPPRPEAARGVLQGRAEVASHPDTPGNSHATSVSREKSSPKRQKRATRRRTK